MGAASMSHSSERFINLDRRVSALRESLSPYMKDDVSNLEFSVLDCEHRPMLAPRDAPYERVSSRTKDAETLGEDLRHPSDPGLPASLVFIPGEIHKSDRARRIGDHRVDRFVGNLAETIETVSDEDQRLGRRCHRSDSRRGVVYFFDQCRRRNPQSIWTRVPPHGR